MNLLLLNMLLGLAWGLLTANMSAGNLTIGFLIGYVVLMFQQRVIGRSSYFMKVLQFAGFVVYFVGDLVKSSLRVAYDVITPTGKATPAIIAVPLDAKTDAEIALLANVISLTPGSLSMDITPDRSTLYVHAMYAADFESVRQNIKENIEQRVIGLLR